MRAAALPALVASAALVSDAAAAVRAAAFDVAPGPLAAVLTDYATQAGVTVLLDPALVEGRLNDGLRGDFTVHEGFATLLRGSGLVADERRRHVFVLRAEASGAVVVGAPQAVRSERVLPPVHVLSRRSTSDDDAVSPFVASASDAANKVSTPLLETPQSVSVVTRAQMDEQNTQTLNAALRYTAGVTPETRGSVATRYDLLKVRGFAADNYWDGLRMIGNNGYAVPQLDPYVLDHIDVVRGPASVLYGQASAGGMLDQRSKLPSANPFHEVGVELGNFGHRLVNFDLTGPVGDDERLTYRVTGLGRTENGQIDHTRNERLLVAPSVSWRPDARTTFTVLGLVQRDPRSASYGSVPPLGTALFNPVGQISSTFYDGDPAFERFDRTQTALGYRFDRELNAVWRLQSRGRWLHVDQDYASVYGTQLRADARTLERGTVASSDRVDTAALDNQLVGRFATGALAHTLSVGVDYQRLDSSARAGTGGAPPIDVFAPIYYQDIPTPTQYETQTVMNQYGIYAQDQVRFERFVLTLGARHDWADTLSRSARTGTAVHQHNGAWSGRAGLTYVFATGLAPYASFSQSFKPQAGSDVSGTPFKPERARQFEAGLKFQPPNTDALFTVAAFDLRRENLLTLDALNPAYQVDAGIARSRGIEFEARLSVSDSLNLLASFTYLQTKYLTDNGGLEGKYLAAVPQRQASLWASYAFQRDALAGLSVGAGARYTGATFNADNNFQVRSFVLFDASLRYDLGRAAASLKGAAVYINAQNLLNRRYVASCYLASWCAYGYGRQVFTGVDYRW
ncbi:TonB-dependent siderophore receptor [Chitinasiproducens palmae]|uniref:Iron complex outermembrane recepter protein n=1 Tax=Chitinasiproducens palmae TaxID=1770053 RepID=A0A1H2PLT1_9BURK|nr:TonB-dependent siderophore receptor [Chitinasiproducens palmae]SDV47342.1 iron complex outermembrane recepter protein [Chitinasiproducens palmae]